MLLDQHESLRALLSACEREAERILAGRECSGRQLLTRLVELLDELEVHNREEESRLRPLLNS